MKLNSRSTRMQGLATIGKRIAGTALVAALALSNSSMTSSSALGWAAAEPPANPVRVTQADVDETNRKAAGAFSALVSMWTNEFGRMGEEFATPRLARYRGVVRTACGVIAPSNASYCLAANTIYYDDVFLAAQAKIASHALSEQAHAAGQTRILDGDMAAVGIIAHEMGHAVAMQLGFRARDSYSNEAVADCLAGAFARHSATDGSLEDGDIDEAFFGMASAGDPTPTASGDPEHDRRIARLISRNSHGTREQRMMNFRLGLDSGSGGCLTGFSAAS
jgi:predicted metalloprotease